MIARKATSADIPALLELDRQTPFGVHWSQEQYCTLFAEGADAQFASRFVFVLEGSQQDLKTVGIQPSCAAPEIIACLVANRVDKEWELENIVVAERSRRQGVASRLLRQWIEHVRGAGGDCIHLEVRESNEGARTLYERFGFEIAGRRKGYYANPPGDAILYRRVVKKFS